MTGVEILASNEVVTGTLFNWTMFWITFGGCLFVFLMIGIGVSVYAKDWANLGYVFIGALAGALFGAIIGRGTEIPEGYETQYKVAISDEVNMGDFFEKYELIEQEGKIYTVRERETH